MFLFFFFFNDPATTEIYTFPTRRSSDLRNNERQYPLGFVRTGASLRFPSKESFSSDRKSTRLNSSHLGISYAVFCLKKKNHESCTNKTTTSSMNTHPHTLAIKPRCYLNR